MVVSRGVKVRRPVSRKRKRGPWPLRAKSVQHFLLLILLLVVSLLSLLHATLSLSPSILLAPQSSLNGGGSRPSSADNTGTGLADDERHSGVQQLIWDGRKGHSLWDGRKGHSLRGHSSNQRDVSTELSGAQPNSSDGQYSLQKLPATNTPRDDSLPSALRRVVAPWLKMASREVYRRRPGTGDVPLGLKSSRNGNPTAEDAATQGGGWLNRFYAESALSRVCGGKEGGGKGEEVDLVIMILSDVGGQERRQAVRDTWLSPYTRPSYPVRHVFIVGHHDAGVGGEVVGRLQREMEVHRDVVQAQVNDSYAALTRKTLAGLGLTVARCSRARHVLKTDHDVWVNVPALTAYLRSFPLAPPSGLGGFCRNNRRPIRHPMSKYYVPPSLYPNDTFPPFCNGPGYVTTPQVARRIVEVSSRVPFFPLEDVFVGLCLARLGLAVKHIWGFGIWRGAGFSGALTRLSEPCKYHEQTVIVRHGFSPEELRGIWGAGGCP